MSEMSPTPFRTIRIADARPEGAGFVAGSFARTDHQATATAAIHDPEPSRAGIDLFAQGFEEGQRAARETFIAERAALQRLVESANALQAEPSEELAMLIGETVYRLLTDIVGQAEIDRDGLMRRAEACTALIAECDNARTLHVNPADLPLLEGMQTSLSIAGDPALSRGDIRIDCSAGWIEHGTSLYLDALRSELGLEGAHA